MIFLSINVRGLGKIHKVNWIRRLHSHHRISFFAIQETQILDAEHINVVLVMLNLSVSMLLGDQEV